LGVAFEEDLGEIRRVSPAGIRATWARWLLPLAWLLAAAGYYGPWIAHNTAALTLSGVDMGEFVKFLPDVVDGSLMIVRQVLYLPPWTVAVTIAVLAGSPQLRFTWPLRMMLLGLAVPVSLQLLPPAWSPATLLTAEFRLQTVALGVSWLLLAGFWLWGRLPTRLTGSVCSLLSLSAIVLPAWQLAIAKPAIDQVYKTPPSIGWGFFVCMTGLALLAAGSALLAVSDRTRSSET
jgi:hypothetical protein